jgi:hypothetical protein
VLELHAVLQAGRVALTLRVITFCCASSESPEPPPQAARKLPIMPNTKLFAILFLMFPSSSDFDMYEERRTGEMVSNSHPKTSTGPQVSMPLPLSAAIFFQPHALPAWNQDATGQNERQVVLESQNQLHTSGTKNGLGKRIKI